MSHIRIFLTALLLTVGSVKGALWGKNDALQLRAGNSAAEGEWRAPIELLRGNRNSGMQVELREENSTHSFYVPTERAPHWEGKPKDGGEVRFTIPADSGDLQFNGVIKGKIASGTYAFEANKDFAAEAGKILKRDLSTKDLMTLAFSRIGLTYIRGVRDVGISPAFEDILMLRGHGLDPEGIKAYSAAGFKEPRDMCKMRAHGATPDYVAKVRAAGFGKTAEEVARLRAHGVMPDYLEGWKSAGINASTEEIVRLRSHGVMPDYGAAWKKSGFEFSIEELIRARSHGVPADFAAALGSAEKKITLDEAIRLRQHGVTAEYYTDVKKQNPHFTADEIVRMRIHGVQADYIRGVTKNRSDLSAEQIVALRIHGVPADYVSALNVPGRTPLDPQAIIDLRNRGISAETARKLRE